MVGGCEETTTGVRRLRAMATRGELTFPMVAVNDAYAKHLFDNRYGTGQSTWDGIMRTTNLVVAGKTVVVAGYGWCGKGVAMRAKGLGARVIVCEVDPIRALEALMDGYQVMPTLEAARYGDIFITVTEEHPGFPRRHYKVMKDGALLANAGHFDVGIDKNDLETAAEKVSEVRKNIREYLFPTAGALFIKRRAVGEPGGRRRPSGGDYGPLLWVAGFIHFIPEGGRKPAGARGAPGSGGG